MTRPEDLNVLRQNKEWEAFYLQFGYWALENNHLNTKQLREEWYKVFGELETPSLRTFERWIKNSEDYVNNDDYYSNSSYPLPELADILDRKPLGTQAELKEIKLVDKAYKDAGVSKEDYDHVVKSLSSWEVSDKEGGTKELHSIKVDFISKKPVDLILPANRELTPTPTVKNIGKEELDEQLWVVCGDEQAPHNNKIMEERFLSFLNLVQPTHAVFLGDLLDFSTISKYPDNPEWDYTPQECLDSGYQILMDRMHVAPDMKASFLEGNHDARIRLEQLRRAERTYGLRPGKAADEKALEPLMSLKNLLRLDELGIEYVQPKGNYTHAEKFITKDLCVIHGDRVGKNAIDNMLNEVDYSFIQGHNHKLIHIQKTTKTKEGFKTQHGLNIGTMANIEGGIGYTARPNWQNHFATVNVKNGQFHIEHAWFDGKNIIWRAEKY